MKISFKGKFISGDKSYIVSGDVRTHQLHQPVCSVQFKSGVSDSIIGTTGQIQARTYDGNPVTLFEATILKINRHYDGSRDVVVEFQRMEILKEDSMDYIEYDTSAVVFKVFLSGENRLNQWVRTKGSTHAEEWIAQKSGASSVEISIHEHIERDYWSIDGIMRQVNRFSPSIKLHYKPGLITEESVFHTADLINDAINIVLLSIGAALEVPIVLWQEDIVILQTDSNLQNEPPERLLRLTQHLGRTPLFQSLSSDNSIVNLDSVTNGGRLDFLLKYRKQLSPAIQSYLWAPSLPIDMEFVTTCTCLEALKVWFLSVVGPKQNFASNSKADAYVSVLEDKIDLLVSLQDLPDDEVKDLPKPLNKITSKDTLTVPVDILKEKLLEIRRPPFKWVLEQMVLHFNIPGEVDLSFVGVRNKIVHTGSYDGEIAKYTTVARMLSRDLMKSILNFEPS